jgi:hypothetical protein
MAMPSLFSNPNTPFHDQTSAVKLTNSNKSEKKEKAINQSA